jgi:hypothetical protein
MATQEQISQVMEELDVFLANLKLYQEKRQASLEIIEVIQEELLQQNEYLAEERQHYYDLTHVLEKFLLSCYARVQEKSLLLKDSKLVLMIT